MKYTDSVCLKSLKVVSEHLIIDREMLSVVHDTKLNMKDNDLNVQADKYIFFLLYRRLKSSVAVENTPSNCPVISLIYVRPNALKPGTARDISARGRYNYYGSSVSSEIC